MTAPTPQPGPPTPRPGPQPGVPGSLPSGGQSGPDGGAQPGAAAAVPPGASAVPRPGPALSPIAAAVARLEGVHELPLHEQPDVYQSVHAELQNALAAIDHA